MLKRKKLLAALLAGTMMLSLVGCGKKADTSGDTTDPNTPPAETQLTPWEEASQIYNTEETDEELYQKALEEGGYRDPVLHLLQMHQGGGRFRGKVSRH